MAITVSAAQRNMVSLIAQVNEDHTPVKITSKAGGAVLLSLGDYRALEETAQLLRVPANARRLIESLAQAQRDDRDTP